MIFAKNLLIKNNITNIIERILWIDSDYTLCITINILDEKAMPEKVTVKTLNELLENGQLEIVKDNFFNEIYFADEELSEKEIEIRNKRWELIKEIVVTEPDIYFSKQRGKLIGNSPSKKYIYESLRLYWRKGNVLNALLPKFRNCGNRGVKRVLRDKKVGRPPKYLGENDGINVTEEISQMFAIGVLKYKSLELKSLKNIFDLIIEDNYTRRIWYENGEKKIELEEVRPKLRQFRYWYETTPLLNSEQRNIRKKGVRKHLLQDRPLLGTSDLYINGPGVKYQIDSTVGDVYLVSEKNRDLVVGRPTVYFVVDVFSRMVVGLYVGLENASWLGATMALVNTVTDKVKFCSEYGIEITEDQWPSVYLPESILADRGEFKGYRAERLTTSFGVRVENAPPYRADLKGIVEQFFRVTNLRIKPFIPGSVTKEGLARGERDYRLDATLTLKEFTEVIIRSVLLHNNSHWLNNYKPDEQMFADGVKLIPNKLWNWGIMNRSGQLRVFSEDQVKLHLLDRKQGRITKMGIHFERNIYYTCEKAVKEGWFQDAAFKSKTVTLVFDRRNMNQVYLLSKDGSYEVCYLLPQFNLYSNITYEEFQVIKDIQEIDKRSEEKRHKEEEANFKNATLSIIENGLKRRVETTNKPNKAERKGNIRENKKLEREENRKKEAFKLGTSEINISRNVDHKGETTETRRSTEEFSPEYEYLLKLQEEQLQSNR